MALLWMFIVIYRFHMYTGNFLDGNAKGKNKELFKKKCSMFWNSVLSNAINYSLEKKPILRKNEVKKHRTEFIFNGEDRNED